VVGIRPGGLPSPRVNYSLRSGGLAVGVRPAWRVSKCAMVTRVMASPVVGRQGGVAGGFGAGTVLLGLPGRPRRAPALGKLFRHGVLVKAHSHLLRKTDT
jgi:hypothetical protein